ncbi:unnamed protein product [Urochloa humidicola]
MISVYSTKMASGSDSIVIGQCCRYELTSSSLQQPKNTFDGYKTHCKLNPRTFSTKCLLKLPNIHFKFAGSPLFLDYKTDTV